MSPADELDALADEILVCDSMPYYADKLRALSATIRRREREAVAWRYRSGSDWRNLPASDSAPVVYAYAAPPPADDAVLKDAERWRVMRHYISPRMASQIFMMSECPKPLDGWSTETWTDAVADAALAQRTAATEGKGS